jgi:hypothetical protein
MAPAWDSVAGSAYRGLIDDQLNREDARKESFEARGQSILTSSGAFVALVFGFSTLVTDTTRFTLDGTTKTLLAVSLSLLVIAAAAGIVTNIPAGYGEADAANMLRLRRSSSWHTTVTRTTGRAKCWSSASCSRSSASSWSPSPSC